MVFVGIELRKLFELSVQEVSMQSFIICGV